MCGKNWSDGVKGLLYINTLKDFNTVNRKNMIHLDFLECSLSLIADKEGVIGRIFSSLSANFLNKENN